MSVKIKQKVANLEKNRLESLMSLGNYGIVRLVQYSCILGKSANYALILLESSRVENWRASNN